MMNLSPLPPQQTDSVWSLIELITNAEACAARLKELQEYTAAAVNAREQVEAIKAAQSDLGKEKDGHQQNLLDFARSKAKVEEAVHLATVENNDMRAGLQALQESLNQRETQLAFKEKVFDGRQETVTKELVARQEKLRAAEADLAGREAVLARKLDAVKRAAE